MRQNTKRWKHNSGDKIWKPFLDLFEISPMSDEEFVHIVKNSGENIERHKKSHYDPARRCLNSIYGKNKFLNKDLTEIDNDFLNGKIVNFKIFLNRVEKYPMSQKTLIA